MEEKRILVVEDEPSVARGLRSGLKKEGFEPLWAQTGKEALETVQHQKPHLVLLDIRLPDMSGYDVCRQLRSSRYTGPVIMVTARDEELDRVLGLELGADDYIVKPFSLRELISRVRAQLRRCYGEYSAAPNQETYHFGEIEIDPNRLQVEREGKTINLTPTEFRMLLHLVRHPERLFNREELVEAVWGYDSTVLNDRTVDVHIHHLREKLEPDPENPRWLVTVRGAGYRFEP